MPYLPQASAADVGFDPARLARVDALLKSWTDSGDVGAAAYAVGRHGKLVAPRFFGRMGPDATDAPIRDDAMFLMASITKPIVYLGAMLLVERGQLTLTDRVTRYLPEFAAHHKEETLVLNLFTHTSGLPDNLANNAELRKAHAPLSKFVEHGIRDTVPLFPPGTNYSYQSVGTNLVAEIVRLIDGRPIAQFLRKKSSRRSGSRRSASARRASIASDWFASRCPSIRTRRSVGTARTGKNSVRRGAACSAAPADFAVICAMMLGGGAVGDVRIAAPATIAAMTRNRMLELPDLPEQIARTKPWGLGWRLNHGGDDDSWGDLLGPRVFGHTGATGTLTWMDPDTGVFAVLLTNAIREKSTVAIETNVQRRRRGGGVNIAK